MSESLGSAYVEIIARLDKLQQGLDKAETMTKRSSKKIQDDMSKVATSADATYNRWLDHINKVDKATAASSSVFLRAREQEQRAVQRLGLMQSQAWRENEAFDKKRLAQAQALEKQQAKIQNAGLRKGEWSAVNTEAEGFNRTLARISRTMAAFAAVSFTIAAVKGFQELVSSGIQFNKEIESAKLGIAAIISTQGEFVTSSGQQLQGVEKLNSALFMSDKLVNQLRIDNLKTTATFEQLVKAFQQTLAPGLGVGFNPDQIRKFTLSMMQAAGAMGINQDMMAEETRSLLKGTITPRNTIIATALGITNEQIRSYKGNAQGLFDFLMGKLKEFQYAGELSQKTFSGLASNLKDAFMGVIGTAFEPLFNRLKEMMGQGINSLVSVGSSGITANPIAVSFFAGINDAVVNSINYLEEFGRGLLGLDQKFQNFDSNRDIFYKIGSDLKFAYDSGKPFFSLIGNIFSTVTSAYNTLPEAIRENGLFYLILYGISKKHPYVAAATATLAIIEQARKAADLNQSNPFLKPGETIPEGPAGFDYIQAEAERARSISQTTDQIREQKTDLNGLMGTFKQFETQSMETSQAYGYFTDYLGQSTYKINETKKSAEDLEKELRVLERTFNSFSRGHFALTENIDDMLRSSRIRLGIAQSGLPSQYQNVESRYEEMKDKVRSDLDKGIKAGMGSAELMPEVQRNLEALERWREAEYKLIDTNKELKTSTKRTFDMSDINQDLRRFEKEVRKTYQDLANFDDEYYIQKAQFSGDFYTEEKYRLQQLINNQQSQYSEYLESLSNKIQEMKDKVSRKDKVDPLVSQSILEKEAELNELLSQRDKKLEDIANKTKEISELNIKLKESERAVEIAQLNKEYSELTGTMQEQLSVSILLLRAEADRAKLGKDPELQALIDRNANRKIAYEQATKGDSFGAGFGAAYDKWKNEMPTMGQMGVDAFKRVEQAIDSAADSLTNFVMTGKMDFTSFVNSIITDLIRMQMKMFLTNMLGGGSGGMGGSGGGNFLSGIGNLLGGLFMGGGDSSNDVGIFHGGGIVGITSVPTRKYPDSYFLNAPRLHSGLKSDEFPAILQKGEAVIPKGQNGGINVSVPVTVNEGTSGAKAKVSEGPMRWDPKLRAMVKGIMIDLQANDLDYRGQSMQFSRGG